MKRIICLFLALCCVLSYGTISSNAKYEGDILFNDIPWGTSYKETIEILNNMYDVEFSEPEYQQREQSVKKTIDGMQQVFTASANASFSVRSLQTVNVAGYPAYIDATFTLLNDGTQILENQLDSTPFTSASYIIPDLEDRESVMKELLIKLESIYGKHESEGVSFLGYVIYGKNPESKSEDLYDTEVTIRTEEDYFQYKLDPQDSIIIKYGLEHNRWITDIDAILAERANEAYEMAKEFSDINKAQFEENAINGDKSGL